MADDLGYGEVGLFPAQSPNERIATPNLDRFGREGMVFTNAYAGYTVCAPSRTTLMTGRHSGRFVDMGVDGLYLPPEKGITTLAQVLQSAGYATGAFGKVAPLTAPLRQGFDTFLGQVDQSLCHNMYPSRIDTGAGTLNFNLSGNWRPRSRTACMAQPGLYNYTADVFHDAAMQWLAAVSTGSKPFFLYLAFTIPHAGGWGDAPRSPEDGQPVPSDLQYAGMLWPDVEKDHAAVITYLDGKVGDLLAALAALNVDQNTLVVFASDNGPHQEGGHLTGFFDSTGGLRGFKRSLYEGGVRSPTMARWPAVIPPMSKSDFAWAFWDVLPTFAELAGGQAPQNVDGISIVPTLLGQAQQPHDYLYWTWSGKPNSLTGYAVRAGNWKGVVLTCGGNKKPSPGDTMELYDLSADQFETTDVSGKHPEVVKSLKDLVIGKGLTCKCFQCGGKNFFSWATAGAAASGASLLAALALRAFRVGPSPRRMLLEEGEAAEPVPLLQVSGSCAAGGRPSPESHLLSL